PYVDVAVHGDGLVSLQYRELPGGPTREIQAIVGQASRLPLARFALERQGELFFISTMATTNTSAATTATPRSTLPPSGPFFGRPHIPPARARCKTSAHRYRFRREVQ